MWNVFARSEKTRNLEYIFPTQQRDVVRLVDSITSKGDVSKVVVFGSSITSACNPWSDLDVYVEYKGEASKLIYPTGENALEAPIDIWTNFTVSKDEELYNEIIQGVTVYTEITN